MKENFDVIEKIVPLFDSPARFGEIGEYLAHNSNLPGPRSNLTLAFKFSDCFEHGPISDCLLDLLVGWVHISSEKAPVNSPREYLPFCGILALGAHYYYADEKTRNTIMEQFKISMNDKRWRTREGAAMGFQKIAEKDFDLIRQQFLHWLPGSSNLEKRAFAAALAHPPILKNNDTARFSLSVCENILDKILTYGSEIRRSEDFAVLSKGLAYSISVFTAALPEDGFAVMKKYARIKDPALNKIIKANLSKTRLTKKYPQMIEEVTALLRESS
ncbi:MAG: hypothetical protein WCG21_05655 [Eubacteriales bacterium]